MSNSRVCYEYQNKGRCHKENSCRFVHIAPTSETLRRNRRESSHSNDKNPRNSYFQSGQGSSDYRDARAQSAQPVRRFSQSIEQQRNEERRTQNQSQSRHPDHPRQDSLRQTQESSRQTDDAGQDSSRQPDGINRRLVLLSNKGSVQDQYSETRTIKSVEPEFNFSIPPPNVSDDPTLDKAKEELNKLDSEITRLTTKADLKKIPAWIEIMHKKTARREKLLNVIKVLDPNYKKEESTSRGASNDVKIEAKSKRSQSRSSEDRSRSRTNCGRRKDNQSRSRSPRRSKECSRAGSKSNKHSCGDHQSKSRRKRSCDHDHRPDNRSRSRSCHRSKKRSRAQSSSTDGCCKEPKRKPSYDDVRRSNSRQGNSERRGNSLSRSRSRQQSGESRHHGTEIPIKTENIKRERDFHGPRNSMFSERNSNLNIWSEPPNRDPWICESCGKNTVSERPVCFHCNEMKRGNWECEACRTVNWAKSRACKDCLGPNPKVWICQIDGCGEYNWQSKEFCHNPRCNQKDGNTTKIAFKEEGKFNNKFYDTRRKRQFSREHDFEKNSGNSGDIKMDNSVGSRNNNILENKDDGKEKKDPDNWKKYFEEQRETNKKQNEIENSKSLKINNKLALLAGNYLTGCGEAVIDQGGDVQEEAEEEDDDEVMWLDPIGPPKDNSEEVEVAGTSELHLDSRSSKSTKRSHADAVRNQIQELFDEAAAGPSTQDSHSNEGGDFNDGERRNNMSDRNGPTSSDTHRARMRSKYSGKKSSVEICIDLSDCEDDSLPVEQNNDGIVVEEEGGNGASNIEPPITDQMQEQRKNIDSLRFATGKRREQIYRENGIVPMNTGSPECIEIDEDDEDVPQRSLSLGHDVFSNAISKGEKSKSIRGEMSHVGSSNANSKGETSKSSSSIRHTGSSNSMSKSDYGSSNAMPKKSSSGSLVGTSTAKSLGEKSEQSLGLSTPEPEQPNKKKLKLSQSLEQQLNEEKRTQNQSQSKHLDHARKDSKRHTGSSKSMSKGDSGLSNSMSKEEKQKQKSNSISLAGTSTVKTQGEKSMGLATPEPEQSNKKKLKLSEYQSRQRVKKTSEKVCKDLDDQHPGGSPSKSNQLNQLKKLNHIYINRGQINEGAVRGAKAKIMKDKLEEDLSGPSRQGNDDDGGLIEDELFSTPPLQHSDTIDEDDDIVFVCLDKKKKK